MKPVRTHIYQFVETTPDINIAGQKFTSMVKRCVNCHRWEDEFKYGVTPCVEMFKPSWNQREQEQFLIDRGDKPRELYAKYNG